MKDFANPYPRHRVADIRTTFEMIDITAIEDATVVAPDESILSKKNQVIDGIREMTKKLGTLELNSIILDGTMDLPDGEDGQVGYMSNQISGDDGEILDILEFHFTIPHSSVGFTFFFDNKTGNFPRDFDIEAFDGSNNLVAKKEVRGNKRADLVVDILAYEYKKLRITTLKTSIPHRRVRIVDMIFGIIYTFGRGYGNLAAADITYETSLNGKALPSGELSITINNKDRKYNMVNPEGIFNYLQRGQRMVCEIGVGSNYSNIEYVDAGTFYYTRSYAKDDALTAEIIGNDKIMRLDKGRYRKGIDSLGTIAEILPELLEGTDIDLEIDPAVENRVISRAIPISTPREAVRMVVQAARCVCFINRDNLLIVRDLPGGLPVGQITGKDMLGKVNVQVGDYYNVAEIKSYKYYAQNEEKSTIHQSEVYIAGTKELWIEHGAAADPEAIITGGTIDEEEHYLFASKLKITAAGPVEILISGYSLGKSETIYRAEDIKEAEEEQIYTLDNPLIISVNAQDWADWALEGVQRRLQYPVDERGHPGLEITDIISIEDPYGENRATTIEKQQYKLSDGVLSAVTTGRGCCDVG